MDIARRVRTCRRRKSNAVAATATAKTDGLLIDRQKLDKLEKMDAEERNAYLSKRSAKLHHLTPAEFGAYKEKREAFYKSMSADEKKEFSQRFAKMKKDWFNGLSDDRKKKIKDDEAQREKDHPNAFHHHDDAQKPAEEKARTMRHRRQRIHRRSPVRKDRSHVQDPHEETRRIERHRHLGQPPEILHRARRAPGRRKKALAEDIKDVYSEAKGTGFEPKVMRKIVSLP